MRGWNVERRDEWKLTRFAITEPVIFIDLIFFTDMTITQRFSRATTLRRDCSSEQQWQHASLGSLQGLSVKFRES